MRGETGAVATVRRGSETALKSVPKKPKLDSQAPPPPRAARAASRGLGR